MTHTQQSVFDELYTVADILKGDNIAMMEEARKEAIRRNQARHTAPQLRFSTDETLEEMGYTDKAEYLEALADNHGIDLETVNSLADLLGDTELFDGLPVALEDYSY